LKDDERRRERHKTYNYDWNLPWFENDFERRRLQILNSLARALERVDATISIHGKEGRGLFAEIGHTSVEFTLDARGAKPIHGVYHPPPLPKYERSTLLQLQIMTARASGIARETWTDSTGDRIERHLHEIAVALVVHGERLYRERAISRRAWVIQRKAEILEQRREDELERQRKERERRARLEQARVDRLLNQAKALRQADQIRAYVAGVQAREAQLANALTEAALAEWTDWALAQADRIDPVKNGSYRAVQAD